MAYPTCPQCVTTVNKGGTRIGSRRSACETCNRFSARVHRKLARSLRLMYPADVERLRPQIEAAVYADMGLGAK